jgi:hypothetical protein
MPRYGTLKYSNTLAYPSGALVMWKKLFRVIALKLFVSDVIKTRKTGTFDFNEKFYYFSKKYILQMGVEQA